MSKSVKEPAICWEKMFTQYFKLRIRISTNTNKLMGGTTNKRQTNEQIVYILKDSTKPILNILKTGWGGSVGPLRTSVWMPRTHVSQAQPCASIIPLVLQQDVSSRQQSYTTDTPTSNTVGGEDRRLRLSLTSTYTVIHNGLVCPHSHMWIHIYTTYTIATTTSNISSYQGNKISGIKRHNNTVTNTYKFKKLTIFSLVRVKKA